MCVCVCVCVDSLEAINVLMQLKVCVKMVLKLVTKRSSDNLIQS